MSIFKRSWCCTILLDLLLKKHRCQAPIASWRLSGCMLRSVERNLARSTGMHTTHTYCSDHPSLSLSVLYPVIWCHFGFMYSILCQSKQARWSYCANNRIYGTHLPLELVRKIPTFIPEITKHKLTCKLRMTYRTKVYKCLQLVGSFSKAPLKLDPSFPEL